jgi:negative regulator of sigma E activity
MPASKGTARRGTALLAGMVGAAAIALLAPRPAAAATSPEQLLRAAVTAYAKYSFVGKVQNTDFGLNRATAELFRIEHRAPDQTRRWYLAPEAFYGDSIVSRGDVSYDVDVHHKRVMVVRDDALDDQVALDDNFALLLRNYKAEFGPEDQIAGRRATDVLLVNRYTGQTVMRVSIDTQTDIVLQREKYSGSGSVSHEMRFEQIHYTGSIPAALFDVPPYPRVDGPSHGLPSNDTRAIERSAGFKTHTPKYLPEGFLPVAGDISVVKGVRTLHMLYSDGLRTVSLFENDLGAAVDLSRYTVHTMDIGSRVAQYVEDGPTTLMSWGKGSMHFALVGELSRKELKDVAASIDP